ncbi:MAG: hypothetical protein WD271_08825 [Acidimicrobiia bacterium]
MPSRVVDIAGVPIALEASDDARDQSLHGSFEGFDTIHVPAAATIALDAATALPPTRVARSELLHIKFWDEPDGIVVATPGLVITVAGSRADAHLPDLAAIPDFEGCVYLPLTWLLARHDRFVLHGAGIVRDGHALLLLGHSGAGKSTLAVAALEAGWLALADDVVIVHASDDGFRIHGVHRTPAVPTEIGGRFAASARRLDDPRDRAALSRGVLTSGGHPLAGVVLITHADAAEGSLREAGGHQVLPMLLQSFAGSIDPSLRGAFFAPAATLSRLPVWELGHAADPAVRRQRAAHHLDRCATALD